MTFTIFNQKCRSNRKYLSKNFSSSSSSSWGIAKEPKETSDVSKSNQIRHWKYSLTVFSCLWIKFVWINFFYFSCRKVFNWLIRVIFNWCMGSGLKMLSKYVIFSLVQFQLLVLIGGFISWNSFILRKEEIRRFSHTNIFPTVVFSTDWYIDLVLCHHLEHEWFPSVLPLSFFRQIYFSWIQDNIQVCLFIVYL